MARYFSLSILFLSLMLSCKGASKSSFSQEMIQKSDSCVSDSKNSYEIYIPQHAGEAKMPLLVILDSHGSGKFALQKFKQASNQYGIALVASNLVKNGYSDYDNAIQRLVEDVRQKYPVNENLFLTGFSGGARMALGYATMHSPNGLILCGALGNAQQIRSVSSSVISIVGMDDFNFLETAQYMFNDNEAPANLKIELTNASHSWPESSTLTDAVGFLLLSTKSSAADAFCKQQMTRIDSLKKQNHWIQAGLVAHNLSSIPVFNKNQVFTKKSDSIQSAHEYLSQMQNLAQSLNEEMTLRQKYIDAFSSKDEKWWNAEINLTNEKILHSTSLFEKDMYQRIKSFWGIVCYSYCKQAVAQHNEEVLAKTIMIYKQIEPQNPDMYYYSAFIPFWQGNEGETVSRLKMAVKAGFNDNNQLKSDFPVAITAKI